MNKVFKVIWNHATQSWVAVSELTSAKGKTKSKKLTALSVAVGSALVGTPALAAVYVNNQQVAAAGSSSRLVISTGASDTIANKIDSTTTTKYDNFIRIGDANDPVTRDGDILIGFGHKNLSSGEAGDTIIGHKANIGGGNLDSFSTGVGYRVQSAGPSVSIGVGARSDIKSNSGWNSTRNGGVAIGAYALQGGNADGGVAVGALSGGDYNYITSIGTLSGVGGYQVDQVRDKGYRVNGGNEGATSIGYSAGARGRNSVAVGREATTANGQGRDAVSVGYSTHSIGESSVALGPYAVAGGFSASEITALETEKTRLEGVIAEINSDWESARDQLNREAGIVSTVEVKFRMGQLLSAREKAQQELNRIKADLNRTSATPTQSTTTAMAIGYKALANNLNATAIGRQSQASAISAVALGTNARVNANLATSAIAIGKDANVLQNSTNAIALGMNASVVGDLNGSSGSIAIGSNTAAGNKNASWGANRDRRLGFLAAQNATAVGSESIAGADNALTLGYKNTVNAPNSSAIGSNNTVGTYSSVAYVNNVASATYSGVGSHVLGSNINVTANNTMVIGNNILVTEANRSGSVVLGDNSSVPTNTTAINSAKVGNITYSGFAGNLSGSSTDGSAEVAADQGRFVSIGNATAPRQIKHVAAGRIEADSTDAINGSQLYSLTGVVSNMGVSVANVIGGNAVLNPNGTVSGFSQPLNTTALSNDQDYTAPTTPAANVSTAITNLNNYVNAGWKIAQGDEPAAKARISPNEQVNFKADGLATVSVAENTTNNGADVTYSVKKGTFDTTTNGTVKANSTEGVVTNADVATAVNNSGWNTTLSTGKTLNVNPGDQVNYVNGNGTTANVTTTTVGGKDVVSVSYNVNETTGTVNPNGTVKVSDNNAFLNASAVANLVNNAGFNVTTKAVDKFAEQTTKTARVKAGGNVTYIAGKNIAIEQDNQNFTFSTTKDVTFENATVNQTLTVGNGTNATNFTSTSEGLKVATSTGDKQAIVNVKSTLPGTADSTGAALDTDTATSVTAPTLTTENKARAATIDDVVNTGWNLRGQKAANGSVEAVDFVKPYDTVVFKSGNNATTDVITTTDDNKVSTVTITAKAEPVKTSGLTTTVNNNGTVSVATGEARTNLVNATTVANAINASGWNTNVTNATTGATETKVVTPGTQVDYVNGNGTTANVSLKDGKVAVSYNVNQTKGSVNTNGTVSVVDGNSFLNASTVANLVNNSAFSVTTAKVDAFAENQEGKANAAVKAGGNITYTAGKNIAIKQAGTNFTFSTTKDVVFNNAQVNSTLTIGNGTATSPKVNIQSTTKGLDMGNAVLTNVSSGITPYAAGTTPVTTAKSGLADLANSTQTNVVTVADAAKLGWVVSTDKTTTDATTGTADGNVYAANVTTANEVKFVGKGYATVSGATDSNGVRTITVSVGNVGAGKINADGSVTETKAGLLTAEEGTKLINGAGWLTNVTNATTGATETKVVTPGTQVNYVDGNGTTANVIKNTVGGKEVVSVSYDVKAGANTIAFNKDGDELVKVGDKYYKVADVVDGKPTNNAVAVETADIATADNRTPYENALNGLVNLTSSVQSNAMTVADAARMGWVVSTSANDYSANVTNTKEVNFVGLGAVDVSGSNVDEIRNINVSVDLPVDYTETTITENGQEVDVVKLSDGKWYKVSDLNDQGEPKDDAVAVDTKVTPISKKGAVLSDASSSLNNNPYKAKEYTYDDVNQTVTPKTYAELLAADPNFNKDEIKEGTNGVKLNNVGWAEAPDQAVNLDQLNQTVYKSGFYVKQNGVDTKGTNSAEDSATEKVTPEDVVNFVNGKNTVLKATTTRNAQTGQDTTNVTVDVDLPVVYTDAEGAKVVKVGDKYYYAEDVENGKLKNGVDADNDAVTNVVASMNNVASDDDTAGNNVVLRNVAEGTKTLAFDTEGNPLVEIDGKYYKLNEDGKADTTTVITPATSEQLKQLDDKYLANFTSAVTGLADLDHSDQSNALTVADAQKLGWVVSAGDYAANVTNANEVRFNGSNGISVTGETDKNTGVRNINVSIAKGKVDGNTTTGVATGDTNYVTGDQVAKAINESGWKTNVTNATTGLPETKVVTPGTQVDYVNGNGTTANVTLKDGKVAVSYNVNQTTGSVNPNGTATVTDGNAFLNASTVANLVNNSAFSVTTAKVDAFAENQEGKANAAVKAGGNITYTAGKNIAISQNGSNFTFSTTKDIEVDSVTANNRVQIGSGDTAVNLTSDSGALQVADKDGNATQITNVEAGTNVMAFNKEGDQLVQVGDKFYVVDPETNEVDFDQESTPATEEELDELAKAKPELKAYVAYAKAASGLADLDNSEQTNALTVADAQRLGWVVSASGNDYADSVTNANEVRFNGVNGVSVTGNTTDGVRNINISLNTTTLTSNANGTTTVTNGNSYVNGTTVADAINKAGWNTTLSDGTTLNVNPGDQVNYVNGNGTTANVTKAKDANGNDVVSVSYNVNQTKGSVNTNGTVSVVDGNSFLNASTVANLVNNSAFSVTTAKVDAFAENQEGKANAAVKAGGNITYTAGKNIAISQNGSNFTFSTTKDIEVDSVTANNRVQIGSGDTAVNLTSDSGALQVADKDGNATQITNVEAGTNVMAFNKEGDQLVQVGDKFYVVDPETNEVDFDQESTPATEEELDELAKAKPELKAYVAYAKAASGLADLDNSEQTNALTVADAQRLGWVVSASGNDYADSVTNANEVRFNGVNGVSVTGNTTDGVRNINISLNTTTLTSNANGTTTVTNGNSYVNGTTVADAINKAGWNTTLSDGTTLNVNPGDQVNYVNGNGTTANVTKAKDANGNDVVSVSYNVNQTKGSVNTNGTVSVVDGNSFLNASTVANLVNNSAFSVTTAKVDAFAENQEGKANAAVKAGGNITYTAGKNIAISQNGSNFTFSTTKDIEVDSVTANNRVQIGSGDTAVNLTSDSGALQVADKDGNATQITNVEAGTNVMAFNKEGDQLVQVGDKFYVVDPETNEVDFDQESTPATEEELDELAKAKPELKAYVAYAKAASGLADLDNSEQTNALTVADAQRLGWVVSASGNDYADSVTNANEVRFNGSNGISVTGETDEHGVRNINVSIAKGNVAGNTTTGVATGDTNYVTGDQVANAINNSGWKTTATKVVDEAGNEIVDANKATAVNPGDSVNYVDGNSTKANVVVTKAADGKETVNVSYDLVTEDHLTPVANDAKSVTKPTNIDAKGKDAATVNDVLNAGWNLQANDEAVDAVTHGNNVNFTSKDGSVKITAKSDGSTSSLDFAVNATSIVNQVAGTISYNKDGKATTNGDGKRIATVGDVANTINNTGWLTNVTDAKGNVTTKVVTPNTQVNYVNGDGTKANVVANSTTGGLDVTFNVKSANPETLTVDGNGVKVNTGSITEATDVAGDANRGKVTVAAGEGNKVATVQNVANAINSASWTVKVADTQEEITTSTANDEGSSVRAGNEITHVAGKNLKVKRDGRNVTYALANDVSVNTVTAQNSIKVGAGNAATTVTTSSAQDGVTEVKLADAAGKATRITNVAAGVKDTDAVNVSQLRNSNAQINQNIAHLNNKVNRMGKDLRAGIAGSNAAAGLPQVYIPGKSMVAAAAGTFKGQSAVAVGYSRASDNGKVILKLQGNANTRGDVGGSVGVGYQW